MPRAHFDPSGNTPELSACVTPTSCLDPEVKEPTVTTELTREACATLFAGPNVTGEGPRGHLILRGQTVVLGNGVAGLAGAGLTVENTP